MKNCLLHLVVVAFVNGCAYAGSAAPAFRNDATLPICSADTLALPREVFHDQSVTEARDSLARAGLLRDSLVTLVAATVKPEISNRREYGQALADLYPRDLIEQGIGGTPIYAVLIDADGKPADVRVIRSSGRLPLDQAGHEAIQQARFTPAVAGECHPRIWISLPITFQVR